ncbi:MAG: hypothetical protein H0U39_10790, partial [Segetibacter sp.]|nr:hypothetical protein [Segetibacter sp.]
MQTLTIPNDTPVIAKHIDPATTEQKETLIGQTAENNLSPGALEKWFINLAIKVHIFYLSCLWLHNPQKIWNIYRSMISLRRNIWGGNMKKLYKVDGKYYYSIYA